MKKTRLLGVVAVGALGAALATAVPATASLRTSSTLELLSAVPSWIKTAPNLGLTALTDTVNLHVTLHYRDEAGLAQFNREVSDPTSKSFRHFLTTEQFNARYAPAAADIAKVESWLSKLGLHVDGHTTSGVVVQAHGSVLQVASALKTSFGNFQLDKDVVRAPLSAPVIPAKLRSIIGGISGLDTLRMKPHSQKIPDASPPAAFLNARPCSDYWDQKLAVGQPKYKGQQLYVNPCGYTPRQLRGAYGLDKVKYTGAGATVAILDAYASPTIEEDLATYSAKHGLPQMKPGQFKQALPQPLIQNMPQVTLPEGLPSIPLLGDVSGLPLIDPEGWSGEETLDVEAVHTFAPGANITYVPALSNLGDFLQLAILQIAEQNLGQVISNSWGEAGDYPTPDDQLILEQAVAQANAKGITVNFSSGDSADEVASSGSRSADFPATNPNVTALGGTSLFVGKGNTYLGEGYWSTEKYLRKGSGWDLAHAIFNGGGGGGDSFTYDQPAYQKGVVPQDLTMIGRSSPGRVIPDISLVGDPVTGYLVGQTQAQAGGQNAYSEYRIGGTSVSCPLLSGILAMTIQANGGGSLGNINPVLYKAAGTKAYRDITAPKKQVAVVRYDYTDPSDPSTALVPSLRTLGNVGTLHLRKGYDDATGLGTPNGGAFITMLARG